jgi:hypothetical protein
MMETLGDHVKRLVLRPDRQAPFLSGGARWRAGPHGYRDRTIDDEISKALTIPLFPDE